MAIYVVFGRRNSGGFWSLAIVLFLNGCEMEFPSIRPAACNVDARYAIGGPAADGSGFGFRLGVMLSGPLSMSADE